MQKPKRATSRFADGSNPKCAQRSAPVQDSLSGAPSGDLAQVNRTQTLEERAARVIAALADDSRSASEAALHLLRLTQNLTGACAAGLYRAVQETGLLVPFGDTVLALPSVKAANDRNLTPDRVAAVMAHAADHAASALMSALAAPQNGKNGVKAAITPDRPFRVRSNGPGGLAIWATAILRRDDLDLARGGSDGSLFHEQLLGVWVVVMPPLDGLDTKPNDASGFGAKPLTTLTLRLHPFYSLLMRQVVGREALESARRQTEKRLREVATIYEIGKAIDRSDIEALFDLITQKAAMVMDAQACSLLIKETDSEQLTIAASCGLPDDVVDNTRIFIGEGVAGRVAQTGLPMTIHSDARLDPRLSGRRIAGLPGISSSISMPMMDEDNKVHGVLCIRRRTPAPPFTHEDERLFTIFATQASLAIRNARLYAQMERQVHELNVLYASSQSLTTTYGLSRACAAVNRVAVEITESDIALLLLFNERLDSLRMRHDMGLTSELRDMVRLLPDSREVHRDARRLREPVEIDPLGKPHHADLFGERWAGLLKALAARCPTLLLVPLVTEEVNVGFLLLGRSGPVPHRQEEQKLVSIISSQAAAVLRSAATYEHSVEQRVLELSALYELSKKVRSARSFVGALESILDIVSSVVWCDQAAFYVADPDTGDLQRQAYRGSGRESPPPDAVETRTIADWVLRERKALLSPDIAADARFARGQTASKARALMAIPVFLGDEALAVLEIGSTAVNLYTEENVKMISLIAAQAAALFREMESLRELTNYTDNILRSIAAGVVTLDPTGKVVILNAAAERILRLSAPDVLETPFEELIQRLQADAVDQEDTLKMVSLAVETGQTVQRHQLRYHCGRGAEDSVVVNGSASQLLNERGEYLGVVLVFEDITKEHEMEQELVRIGRLAEIGELAAGIAHELRNPLTSIKGAAQVVLREMNDSDGSHDWRDHREFLEIIVGEVDVLSGVTSEFLEFSRFAPPQVQMISLTAVLAKRVQFLRPEFERADIGVQEDYDPDLPQVEVDANQLERVFTNIILNAVQAMPEGGLLTVKASLSRERDGFLEIAFSDTGLGISEAQIEKIFTPFFTTKTKGTGLGLAIVHKTMDAHGGRVTVTSQPGQGATFTLFLPMESPVTPLRVLISEPLTDISAQRLHAAPRLALAKEDAASPSE